MSPSPEFNMMGGFLIEFWKNYSHQPSNEPNSKIFVVNNAPGKYVYNLHGMMMNAFLTATWHIFAVIWWKMQKFLCWQWRGVKIQFNHSMDHMTLHLKHRAICISLVPKMCPCTHAFYSTSSWSNLSSCHELWHMCHMSHMSHFGDRF